jgi:HD-GYP domain-containing protein (c-di-GMP phosphodiesterase class II)
VKERNESAEYDIDDPDLLQNMMLSQSVKHPDTGVVLVTRKTPITEKIILQLSKRDIERVWATPVAGETLNEAVTEVTQIFSIVEDIISAKGQSINSAVSSYQEMSQVKELQGMVKKRMKDVLHLFNPRAADAMIELNNHHPNTARHSIISGFNVMAIAKELGWNEDKTLNAVMAAMQHDIGKIKVRLDTLEWPGRLNKKQWGEMKLHSLFGGRLLYSGELDLPVMVALTHHEWYSTVPGKGYGGFSLFRSYLKKGMKIDVTEYLKKVTKDDLEIMQVSAMADMVSALEEIRSYKGALAPFKVLVIMNSDAQMGHFNPQQYRAWHATYLYKHDTFLPAGLRVALPREKEQKLFTKGPGTKLLRPVELLTFSEMEKLGVVPYLFKRGLDVDRIRRRGGLVLERLRRLDASKGALKELLTPEAFKEHKINLVKKVMPRERQLIAFDAFTRSLSYKSLEKMELLFTLKQKRFDLELIKKNDGISIVRLEHRGVDVKAKKMERLGINPLRSFKVRLPGFEERLSMDDLIKLGIPNADLKRKGLLTLAEKSRNGLALSLLHKKGFLISPKDMVKARIDAEKKIFYDIIVVKPVSRVRAEFAIVREGDDLAALEKRHKLKTLDTIQQYLYESVGIVELDFSDLLDIPEKIDELKMGDHWRP